MNILYATDGSDCARIAGRLLASLPLPRDTRITVLSAVPGDDWVESMLFTDTSAQEHQPARRLAQWHAERGAALLGQCSVPVDCSVGREGAESAILHRAEADQADLIVVGCHGKGAIERLLVGSISERVARHARRSVLVARRDKVERVIVAVDGSESSEHALDALARLPLPRETRVTVVYVAPWYEGQKAISRRSYREDEILAEKADTEPGGAERIVANAEQRLRAAGRAAEVCIRGGLPAEQLIAAARELGADLIVVGSANRTGLDRLFLGSVSTSVLHHAPCSVLIARSAPMPAIVEAPASGVAGASV
jgi:nucleotide-binding universal stress UspA family protein